MAVGGSSWHFRTQAKPGGDIDKARMGKVLGNSEEMWDPWENQNDKAQLVS